MSDVSDWSDVSDVSDIFSAFSLCSLRLCGESSSYSATGSLISKIPS